MNAGNMPWKKIRILEKVVWSVLAIVPTPQFQQSGSGGWMKDGYEVGGTHTVVKQAEHGWLDTVLSLLSILDSSDSGHTR